MKHPHLFFIIISLLVQLTLLADSTIPYSIRLFYHQNCYNVCDSSHNESVSQLGIRTAVNLSQFTVFVREECIYWYEKLLTLHDASCFTA